MAANVQLSGSAADMTASQPPESGAVITFAVDSSGKQDIGRQMLMDDDDLIAFARNFAPLPTAFVCIKPTHATATATNASYSVSEYSSEVWATNVMRQPGHESEPGIGSRSTPETSRLREHFNVVRPP